MNQHAGSLDRSHQSTPGFGISYRSRQKLRGKMLNETVGANMTFAAVTAVEIYQLRVV